MLTPCFELSQSDKEVILLIRAPMCNINDTELNVDEERVIFYSSPYYLRIHLPGKVQDDVPPGSYDCDKGEFKFILKKINGGEYFSDLDLIGKLLNPKKTNLRPDIRLCNDVGESSGSEDDNEWLMAQELYEPPSISGPKFGFADKCQGLTVDLRNEFFEILDITDVGQTDKKEWSNQRKIEEKSKFSEDHYLADFMDSTSLKEILEFVPNYQTSLLKGFKVELTATEKEELKNIGNKDFLLDANEKRKVLLSLVDIIFAYAYNHRTTLGENTVESAWTVNKLSSTLSWLESFSTIREVKISSIRRSLVYPLFRHWELSMAVINDTIAIFKLGRRQILKCLIEIHTMFNASEPRYLLNQFYITDYCIWVQKVSDKTVRKLAESFAQLQLCKADMELELEELEAAALVIQEEEIEIIMAAELKKMALCQDTRSSNSSELSSESDSYESSDSAVEESVNHRSESADSSLDSDDISQEE